MWLEALNQALAQTSQSVTFYFRDDDAGWGDAQLAQLLDLFEAQGAPIDLAVIPQALTRELALQLCARRARRRELLGLHQHGYAHVNHETSGRKCEFGAARSAAQQARDIAAGRLRLSALLGSIDPIFTPPWNRCTEATIGALKLNGFQVLARDAGAAPLGDQDLSELGVHVDWCKLRDPVLAEWQALGTAIAAAVSAAAAAPSPEPVGIMLHHGVMGAADWQHLDALLAQLQQHPQARCVLMRELEPVQHRRSSHAGELARL